MAADLGVDLEIPIDDTPTTQAALVGGQDYDPELPDDLPDDLPPPPPPLPHG